MPQYFFNSSISVQSPYFFLPPDLLRFGEGTRGVLKLQRGKSSCEKSYFGIPVESQSNKLLVTSLSRSKNERSSPNMVRTNDIFCVTRVFFTKLSLVSVRTNSNQQRTCQSTHRFDYYQMSQMGQSWSTNGLFERQIFQ